MMRVDTIQMDMVLYDARNCLLFPGIVNQCSAEHAPNPSHHWANPAEWTPATHCAVQFRCSGAEAAQIYALAKFYMDYSSIQCADFQVIDTKNMQLLHTFKHCYVTDYSIEADPYVCGPLEHVITIRFSVSPAC